MRKRRDVYESTPWVSKENRQLLKIGVPIVIAVCLALLFMLTRGRP